MAIESLSTIVCIVGSGFCGYAAYRQLTSKNINVLLVEGGNITTPESKADQPYYQMPLASEFCSSINNRKVRADLDLSFRDRKFTLGGSSECWSGWIKPLERTTYSNTYNSLIYQGWGSLDLTSYDEACLNLLNSPISDFNPQTVAEKLGYKLPALPEGLYYTTYAWAAAPLRLKSYWTEKAVSSPDEISPGKNVLVGYKLITFEPAGDGRVSTLVFENLQGKKLRINAESFIIAMGGIENARFAKQLASAAQYDQVKTKRLGHFQEHPHIYEVLSCSKGKVEMPDIISRRIPVSAGSGILVNDGFVNISIAAWDGQGSPKASFMINSMPPQGRLNGIKNIFRPLVGRKVVDPSRMTVAGRCEQTPTDTSRINFDSNGVDKLNWQVTPSDFRYYSEYLRRYSTYMLAQGFIDDVELQEDSVLSLAIPSQVKGGAHHMSTVAFADDPASLVDEDFRLSGYDNIYVVGSSVFPTSGFENPTHAAMATALKATDSISRAY